MFLSQSMPGVTVLPTELTQKPVQHQKGVQVSSRGSSVFVQLVQGEIYSPGFLQLCPEGLVVSSVQCRPGPKSLLGKGLEALSVASQKALKL